MNGNFGVLCGTSLDIEMYREEHDNPYNHNYLDGHRMGNQEVLNLLFDCTLAYNCRAMPSRAEQHQVLPEEPDSNTWKCLPLPNIIEVPV